MSQHDTQSTEAAIPIAEIAIDPMIQPRLESLDPDHVATLAEAGSEAWPPLVVAERDGQYTLIDGRHRLEAAKQLGIASVVCRVAALPEDGDLRAMAFDLNKAHGKPLTLADRKAEAERLLRAGSNASNNALAQQCGLSDKTVATIRERLEGTSDIPKSSRRVGADGKDRPASPTRSTTGDRKAKPSATAPRAGEEREPEEGSASRPQPSLVALGALVEQVRAFLEDHAGDELGALTAQAIAAVVPDGDRWEVIGAMRLLGEQLIAAADRLNPRVSSDETKEHAA